MTPHHRLTEAARRVREPLYLVTGLYVVVGFCVGGYGAVTGDRLAACLGFFFVSGALGAALIFHGMSRLAYRLSTIDEHLIELHSAVQRLELAAYRESAAALQPPEAPMELLDLASAGTGDPSELASASLDRSVFPRLVETTKNAQDGHTDEAPIAPPLSQEAILDRPMDEPEQSLRRAFAARVRERDYVGAMAVGEQILEVFADLPIAAEFDRLRPLLQERAQRRAQVLCGVASSAQTE